ncbi:hypothetical protein C0995_003915 [Termitomyces sp. Mi166|nr:hypothetical protein C0995_003915 [Termitomyces sp. Mi166\
MAQCALDTTAPKPAAINLNDQHQNNLEVASALLQGLNPAGGLFRQAAVHEDQPLGAPPIPIPPASIKEDACSEHMLSYVNEPDVGTAPEQA